MPRLEVIKNKPGDTLPIIEKNILVCEEYKTIFSGSAKVATSSIRNYFKTQNIQMIQCPYSKLNEYKNYFTFSFVRNPWDRMVSLYCNKILSPNKVNIKTGVDICFEKYEDTFYPGMSFGKFVKNIVSLNQTDLDEQDGHIYPQYWRTCAIGTQNIILDFVGKFENINKDWWRVCKTSGLPFKELEHKNKVRKCHYSYYYDIEIKNIVSQYWSTDINLFNYTFEKIGE